MKRYCGRDFSDSEVALIRTFIAEDPQRSRAALSRLACRALHWYQPDGGLKEMSCRVAMLRMQKDNGMDSSSQRHRDVPKWRLIQPLHEKGGIQDECYDNRC
jgi:hypothetical protein